MVASSTRTTRRGEKTKLNERWGEGVTERLTLKKERRGQRGQREERGLFRGEEHTR